MVELVRIDTKGAPIISSTKKPDLPLGIGNLVCRKFCYVLESSQLCTEEGEAS